MLLIHNAYREVGGEDVVVEEEHRVLEERGHDVVRYQLRNDQTLGTPLARAKAGFEMIWSRRAADDIRSLVASERPDLAHIHNTHFRVSLAAVRACGESGVPIVMTLHNYRYLCPGATFFRKGSVCESCLAKVWQYPAIVHGCWRGSAVQSAGVAAANALHTVARTFDLVDQFIAPSAFVKQKYVDGGIAANRITVRPHSLATDPGSSPLPDATTFAYVGRLSAEKGTDVLIEAWRLLGDLPLRVVGTGPMESALQALAADQMFSKLVWLGSLSRPEAIRIMRESTALLQPSSCYETFGMATLEAAALGRAAIVPSHGALAEIVIDGHTGLQFRPSDPASLAAAVTSIWEDREKARSLGAQARRRYEEEFNEDRAYQSLMEVYESTLSSE